MELFDRGLVTGSSISLFQMSQKDLRSRYRQKGTNSFAQMIPQNLYFSLGYIPVDLEGTSCGS
jgi:hypothetical protein